MEFHKPETKDEDIQIEEAPVTPASGDILAEFGSADDVVVHKAEVEVGGKLREFFIRELDYKNLTKISGRKYRKGPGGALEFDVLNADNNVTAWTLHLGVVTNSGTTDEPNWTPLWTLDQLIGSPEVRHGKKIYKQAKKGLLDNGHESARLFIFEMLSHVWAANPTLDPTLLLAE